MGDYNASFWGPEQNKIEKLRKPSTLKFSVELYITFVKDEPMKNGLK